MPDRLTSLDASFLYLEEPAAAMHVGSVMVFQPPEEGFDHDQLVRLVSDRIAYVPRYRQRVRELPGHVANPVWVDDEDFDVSYHVRRSALPRPGSDEQLEEFVARVQARPLDRGRPLWEVYLVEGLAGGRLAIVTKTHQALVDGINAVDIGQIVVDGEKGEAPVEHSWHPVREPSDLELLTGALVDAVRRPNQVIENVRGGLADVRALAGRVVGATGGVAEAVFRSAARPAPHSPLNAHVGEARRFAMVATDLEDYRTARSRLARGTFSDDVSVHDVVLATVAGALRNWLLTRGESVSGGTTVRAMVPVSVYGDDRTAGRLGSKMAACFVDLPVGEPNPAMRLHQIAFSMRQQMEGGQALGAQTIAGIAGFAPPTLHSLGARLGSAMSRRLFNVVITNVPGPQQEMYAGGALLLATYPVMPLARGQALSIGLTSYLGSVYYGLNGDREAMSDIHVLEQCLVDALAELVDQPPRRETPRPERRR
ncbi:MAG TPA: wax ester/triacylglycerol synthase family O-acyltransferase [Segeticoccus sp.]|uniref:WS/DGAT/MGAT family O-acyltransferase n=1 Tax=Segeticoccus sp. TaxID=2706531 RepID=UPI002D7EDE6C|nr:wax ester/triacylglycerol synthase family O-acyltransferase [Segeticoccus sp.]HET8600970.1 wax ester/triacylglycerol synthase family O-acyltransferase [Segeticoccus sp.]